MLSWWFFFYHYWKFIEDWVGALVLYVAVVSEVKRTNFTTAQPKVFWALKVLIFQWLGFLSLSEVNRWRNQGISPLCRRFRGLYCSNLFYFSMTVFLFSLSKYFLTSGRSFSLLRRRHFGGLVVCLADTAEYFVSWSADT